MNPLFQSERLLFRQFTLDDAGIFYELNSDPEVVKYVHEPPTTKENAPQIIRDIILPQYDRKLGRWATFLKDNNEFIGWSGLKYLANDDEIDLGYRFKKSYWGKGYATEAAKRCIEYGFSELGLKRIVARAHIENTGSLNVLEKCGMNYVRHEEKDATPTKFYELLNPLQ